MIPLVDAAAQYRNLKSEIDAAVTDVLASGAYILGPALTAFEQAFGAWCGAQHALGTSSGTSALHLALEAAGIGPGDEVITVPFTFVASVAAIRYTGAVPVLVDVDPKTYTIDPDAIARAVTPRTRAILPVHLYGQAADVDAVQSVARQHGLVVIEDAAQAHGARWRGARVGTIGDIGCFSFYPSKNLGACGEGGLVTTSDAALAHKVRCMRDWGQEKKGEHIMLGFNARLESIQAAILNVKLRHLDRWNARRQEIARLYDRELADAGVVTPAVGPHREHVYHVYAVRSPARDGLRAALAEKQIASGVHYGIPVHLQKAHADLGYTQGDFPVSEALCREMLSLPIYPEMTDAQVREVAGAIRTFMRSHAAAAAR